MKQAEFLVTAETEAQVELGVNYALRQIEKGGRNTGEHTIPKFEIKVKWRVADVAVPAPEALSILPPPPVSTIDDVSLIDIEEARGVIVVLNSYEELDTVEAMEVGSGRFPGGRKGVLHFIKQKRDELERAEKVAKAKADEDAKAPEPKPPKPEDLAGAPPEAEPEEA